MANVVKLKRGSGSDPQASDLVLGELAVRTDNGKLFTKKDDGSVAEISGGGIEDGDKGDITVSNSGATFTIDNDAVTNSKLENMATQRIMGRTASGSGNPQHLTAAEARGVLNVEDGATADQTASEIVSLLSDQNVSTSGSLTGNQLIGGGGSITDLNATQLTTGTIPTGRFGSNNIASSSLSVNATSKILGRVSSGAGACEELTAAQIRTLINVEDGATADQTAAEIRTLVGNASDSNVFTDALLSKLNGIAASATNVTNNNQLTNGAGYITATLTNEQVQDIVGAMVSGNTESGITVTYQDGDGTLDFSVASQTDQNFTTTLKNKLDGIESGATADQTAAEIRTLVGNASDSNVFTDALLSKLNGIASGATNVTNTNQLTNGAGFITATLTNEQVQDIVGAMVSGNTESGITVTYQDGDGTIDFSVASQTDNNFTNADHSKLDGIEAGATADQSASEILTLIKTVDGSGSGLDADTVDGYNPQVGDSVNTLVLRNSSGYIFGNYLNMNGTFSNSPNTSGMATFTGTNGSDNYGRSFSAAAARTLLNVADGATAGGGAEGGGSDEIFWCNGQNVTSNYTIPNGKNAMSAGPITINSGVTVTVGSGETWTVV